MKHKRIIHDTARVLITIVSLYAYVYIYYWLLELGVKMSIPIWMIPPTIIIITVVFVFSIIYLWSE